MKAIKAETQEQQLKVLEILEQEGYRWMEGQLPTEYIPCINSTSKATEYIPCINSTSKENKYIRINESRKKLTTRTWLEPGDIEIPYEQFVPKTKKVIL